MRRGLRSGALIALLASCSASQSDPGGSGGDAGATSDASMGAGDGGSSPGSSGGSSSGSSGGSSGSSGGSSSSSGGSSGSSGSSSGGTPGNLVPGTTTLTIQAAGQSRSVYLHVPQAVTGGPVPLVIALHGDGDTNTNFVTTAGLVTDSDSEGFVLAAPQGITRDVPVYDNGSIIQTVPQVDWDPYNSIQASGSITAANNDDVPLLDAIRTQLVASGSIDVHHLVIYGYSQGGYLSFRYGMSDAADLACAAVLAAAHPLPGTQLVEQAARKIPVVIQIGTGDSAYSNAQSTVQELMTNGNLVQFNAIQGAGHVPPPGDPKVPLDWCLMQKN